MYVRTDIGRRCTDVLIRLYELFPCYVRGIFAFKWVLTFAAFSLNNRDTLRERSSDGNSSNAFHLWSMRPNKTPYKSTTGPTAVAVTVHRTATADFGRSKHDSDNEPELDKSV